MHLKEALNVFIYGRFWVFGSVSAFFITAAARFKSLYCQSAFATYQTVCLQMKLNNVHLICLNNAHSFFFFFSQEGEKCWDLYKNVKQFRGIVGS